MNLPTLGRFVQPDVVATHFFLRTGDIVADFGAGSGYFLPALSAGVGESGRVYACEIQKALVDKLANVIQEKGLQHVQPLWCDLEEVNGIPLHDGALDTAVLINTLFMLDDKPTAVGEMLRTVRRGGNFFMIDWSESFGGLGPHPDQVVTKDAARAFFEAAGCTLEREFPAGEHHYGLAFKKL